MNLQDNLIKGFLENSFADSKEQREQLIRILSRSGTIPKIKDLQIQYLSSKPNLFFIEPGKALRIGVNLLSKPRLVLLILRYGIEWQIWYKATINNNFDSRICDFAASLAVTKFVELLPETDKSVLNDLPSDLKMVLNKLVKNSHPKPISNEDFKTLNQFHELAISDAPLDIERLNLVEKLAVPTETMLMSNGDVRLNVDEQNLLNVYGCRPFPRPEAFTFASSTATSVSNIGFDLTQHQREIFINNSVKSSFKEAYIIQKNDLIERLKKNLLLGKNTDVLLSPSGTDAALLFSGICNSLFKEKVVHVLVASDETGSGVPLALQGRNFANNTALGVNVTKEEKIEGFNKIDLVKIPLRNSEGYLKKSKIIDTEVVDAIHAAYQAGHKPVLHVMDQSKLGYASPSQECLDELENKYGDDLLILVDNSQLRIDPKRIKYYIEKGYVMTITGSKFFTGPPFCGALLIPEKRKTQWLNSMSSLPIGLNDYYLKSELPEGTNWSLNLNEGVNVGSYMRWYAALTEMERYFKIPLLLRELGVEMFCCHVAERIEDSEFLTSLQSVLENDEELSSVDRRTIFPFFITLNGRVLKHSEMDKIYRHLNKDISELIEIESGDMDRIAKQVCHIGQPVKVIYRDKTPSAVVRISLGARVLSESWKDRDVSIYFHEIENQMHQVDMVIKKIKLILSQPQLFVG